MREGKWQLDVQATSVTNSGTIIGFVKDSYVEYTSIVGNTDAGWSLCDYSPGYKFHKGQQKYGNGFKTGDKVSCILDLGKGTLEFLVNGASKGIAFENVKGPLRPAVSMKRQNASVKIANLVRL